MNAWHVTNRWWQAWQKYLYHLRTETLSVEDRQLLCRSACLAQAEYVMALAVEKEKA